MEGQILERQVSRVSFTKPDQAATEERKNEIKELLEHDSDIDYDSETSLNNQKWGEPSKIAVSVYQEIWWLYQESLK